MALQVCFLLLLMLSLSLVAAHPPFSFDTVTGIEAVVRLDTCNGQVGDCIGEEEEGMMASEAARRTLAQRPKYISYNSMNKNSVPCNRPGQSYYNCGQRGKANPYKRGCSAITRCAKFTG